MCSLELFSPLVPMDALFIEQTEGEGSFAFESLSTQPASKAWKGMMSLLKGAISSAEAQTFLDAGVH